MSTNWSLTVLESEVLPSMDSSGTVVMSLEATCLHDGPVRNIGRILGVWIVVDRVPVFLVILKVKTHTFPLIIFHDNMVLFVVFSSAGPHCYYSLEL